MTYSASAVGGQARQTKPGDLFYIGYGSSATKTLVLEVGDDSVLTDIGPIPPDTYGRIKELEPDLSKIVRMPGEIQARIERRYILIRTSHGVIHRAEEIGGTYVRTGCGKVTDDWTQVTDRLVTCQLPGCRKFHKVRDEK